MHSANSSARGKHTPCNGGADAHCANHANAADAAGAVRTHGLPRRDQGRPAGAQRQCSRAGRPNGAGRRIKTALSAPLCSGGTAVFSPRRGGATPRGAGRGGDTPRCLGRMLRCRAADKRAGRSHLITGDCSGSGATGGKPRPLGLGRPAPPRRAARGAGSQRLDWQLYSKREENNHQRAR